jgi:hydrogenase expression/formation protein HypC
MCLGIPGRVVEFVDPVHGIVKADVGGVRRNVNAQLIEGDGELAIGDWVLIHVGFAMAKIDEQEAEETYRMLEGIGQAYEDELRELAQSDIE